MHLDGARVFNAAVSLGVPVSAITELVTSVQFCLSKVRFKIDQIASRSTKSLSGFFMRISGQMQASDWGGEPEEETLSSRAQAADVKFKFKFDFDCRV